MDKAILKSFAIESRKDLMEKIDRKIKLFYVDEEFRKDNRGDIIVLSNDKHTLTLTKEEDSNRDKLIRRIVELGYEQVVEEAAYTWFNRIIAIRYMEINDYLPLTKDNQSLGIRVLSSKDNKLEPEILKFSNLSNPELDISFDRNKYLEYKDDSEKYKYILLLVCKKLGKVIPQVFDGVTDYIDILIPENLLNDQGFISKLLNEVDINYFNQVEIIGWLYQYYNQSEKDRVMAQNRAYKKEEIPYVTQLFTPDWVVKYMVENSLGKYWIERSNNKELSNTWKYLIDNNINYINEQIMPQDITFIDPCCGSGHILVYAFEILFQIYQSAGYSKKDIPTLILENNLYGLDIDDRAGQLSILSILLKAREYDKDIFNKNVTKNLNIMSIQDSINICNIDVLSLKSSENDKLNRLIEQFEDAKDIGSLLMLEEEDYSNIESIIINDDTIFGSGLRNRLLPLIKISKILSKKYDIVVTNPPYLTNKNMNKKLQSFVNKYYETSKRDLYSCFIKQCGNLTKENGLYAMITIHTWMFLSAFKKIRKDVVMNHRLLSMVHMGAGVFKEINTFNVLATSFVIQKTKTDDYNGIYIRLVDYANEEDKIKMFFDKKNYYICSQKNIRNIQDNMFLYYLSENMLNILNTSKNIGELFRIKPGMTTSNNAMFVRNWYEVNFSKIGFNMKNREIAKESNKKWFPYNNGGNYRKWYGNNEAIVNWQNDGEAIKNYKMKMRDDNPRFNVGIAALNDIFNKGLTYSIFGFRNFGIRYKDYGFLFDVSGASIFTDENNELYLLGFLASKVSFAFLSAIAPSVNFQAGDISSVPYIFNDNYKEQIDQLVKRNIEIAKEDWDSFETSWDFSRHPLINGNKRIEDAYKKWEEECSDRFTELKENETKLNKLFIEIYNISEDITPEVDDEEITIRKADKARDIKSLISYAVGCMFGRYSLDECGLQFAGEKFDKTKYKLFIPDDDNIIPISDSENVYYTDDIVGKFVEFIKIAYGEENLCSNLDYIAEALGKRGTESNEDTIRRYFVNDFYNEHIKTYQKTPIYWLFDSGKKNGFKCLVYIHRYNEQIVSKIRTKYLHNTIAIYQRNVEEIDYKLNNESLNTTDKRALQSSKVDLNSKITECNEYEEKVGNVANKMIKLDLDDGVVVNYARFIDDNGKSILAKIK